MRRRSPSTRDRTAVPHSRSSRRNGVKIQTPSTSAGGRTSDTAWASRSHPPPVIAASPCRGLIMIVLLPLLSIKTQHMHGVLRVRHHSVGLMGSPVPELVHYELGLIDADGHQRRGNPIAEIECRKHVAYRDRVERRGHKDGTGGLHGMLPHCILSLEV